jgi:protein-tyrosine-phosphatase
VPERIYTVLFLGAHNSARSIMAKALLSHLGRVSALTALATGSLDELAMSHRVRTIGRPEGAFASRPELA